MTDPATRGLEIILLAAGGSARLGHPKQLVSFRGQSLLRHSASEAVATGAPVHVVLGAGADKLMPELAGLGVDVVVNEDWRSGISGSIRSGCRRLADDFRAVLIMLCDQPMVTTEHLLNLMRSLDPGSQSIAATAYGGTVGVPAVFESSHLDSLLGLEGDSGAKSILDKVAASVTTVEYDSAAIDVDQEEDVRRLDDICR